jgi:uncharacterized ParB-like nuclease family protein
VDLSLVTNPPCVGPGPKARRTFDHERGGARRADVRTVEEMVEAAPQFPSVDVATFRTQGGREWHGCSGARPIGLRRASGGAYRAARTRSRPVTSRTVRAFEATGTG